MRELGLVTNNKKLAYGWGFGFGKPWMPSFLQHSIVAIWNPIACHIWGHDWFFDLETLEEIELPTEIIIVSYTHEICTSCCARRYNPWYNPEYVWCN